MELPTRKPEETDIDYTEYQGSFSAAGELAEKHQILFRCSSFFAVLLASVSSAGGSGDSPGHVQQVKCLIYSPHVSGVQGCEEEKHIAACSEFFQRAN